MKTLVYNLSKSVKEARRKIKDRGIKWEEAYRDKSESLKKRYEKDIGPGAYRRWEGHDYTTDSDYYIVVGPTIQRELGKCFFAGIKKLPKDPHAKVYSPDGEYFTSISGAYSHASEKWGVPYPQGQENYMKDMLAHVDIAEHIKG